MPRPIALDDFRMLRLVSDPQIAPDGSRVACVVKRIDPCKNRYVGEIWVAPYPTGNFSTSSSPDVPDLNPILPDSARRFTSAESGASHPRWSPDGRTLAFLSNRQKPLSQIYLLPADGGEARPLTKLETEGSIDSFRWSPDGRWIAFTFRATPEASRKETVEARKEAELSSPVRHHTRLFYRLDGTGYFDDSFPKLWVADATTGEAHQITEGPYPCSNPTWSPDSATLAFLSDRRTDRDIAPAHDEIYTISVSSFTSLVDKEALRPTPVLIPSPPGGKEALIWSPDGAWFAYSGNPDPLDTWGTNNDRIYLLPVTGGDMARDLTGHTDWTVGYLSLSDSHELGGGDMVQWSADGKSLYFPASVRGDTLLCRVDIDSKAVVSLTEGGEVGSFAVQTPVGEDVVGEGRAPRIVVALGNVTSPHELVAVIPDRSQEASGQTCTFSRFTDFNSEWRTELECITPETLMIDNHDGGTVHGWLLKPLDFVEGQRYPLVVYVHGGPHTQYGDTLMHEFQLLAARGYVVLYTNPRGSKGYGEAYTKAIFGNWGSVDFQDIMTATDHAVGLEFVDPERTAIMGGSYGGFMTAWAVGHTDRYRCAIADRLVANLQSMSGTCDFPWRPDTYYPGNGWSDPAQLWRCSPLAYAGNIRTPLLLIHSDGDLRCPAGQAEEMFAALRLQRKTVEYIRYPAEASHGLSRNGPPDLRQDRLERNLAWLDRWLKEI